MKMMQKLLKKLSATAAATACLLSVVMFQGAWDGAQAGNLFEVRGVEVDATAGSVTEARDKALAEGQAIAFNRLLKRLTQEGDWPVLPQLGLKDSEMFVRGFRVQNEKTSSRRYLASLSVVFEPETVLELLRNMNIPISETQAKPALLLPVLEDVTGYKLWDEHWWAQSWKMLDLANVPAPMVMALGDPDDRALLDVEDVLLGDTSSMAALAARYNVDTVVIAHALATEVRRLDVSVYQYSSAGSRLFVRNYKNKSDVLELGAEAAADILSAFSEEWKQTAVVQADEQVMFTVAADYERMGEWLTMLERLESASFVKALDVHVLTSRGAILSLSYTGSVDQLTANLAQRDMLLREDKTGWRLKLRR